MQTVLEQSSKKKLATLFPEESRLHANAAAMAQTSPYPPLDTFIPQAQMQPAFGSSLSPDTYQFSGFPGFIGEGLPAFPGQQFSMGADYQLNSEAVHPDARAAFLGQHLDPHMSLQHESNDWDSGYYMLDENA